MYSCFEGSRTCLGEYRLKDTLSRASKIRLHAHEIIKCNIVWRLHVKSLPKSNSHVVYRLWDTHFESGLMRHFRVSSSDAFTYWSIENGSWRIVITSWNILVSRCKILCKILYTQEIWSKICDTKFLMPKIYNIENSKDLWHRRSMLYRSSGILIYLCYQRIYNIIAMIYWFHLTNNRVYLWLYRRFMIP